MSGDIVTIYRQGPIWFGFRYNSDTDGVYFLRVETPAGPSETTIPGNPPPQ